MRHLTLTRAVALAAAILLVPLPAAGPASAVTILPGVVEPTSIDFGIVTVMTTSPPRRATYRNPNPFPVTVSSVTVLPESRSWMFPIVDACSGITLAPSATCVVDVRMAAPAEERAYVAELGFQDGSATGATVPLSAYTMWGVGAVAWQPATRVRGSGTNDGGALARSATASTEYLHAVYTGDTVGGVPVGPSGPYRLVSYVRSSTDGSTWSAPIRLNPADEHGTAPAAAAAGSSVYATWISLAHPGLHASGPRVLYVRVNRSHGTGAWTRARSLSSLTGRVFSARVAAAGDRAFVAYTAGGSGAVRVARTGDAGRTWATSKVGSTTRGPAGSHDAGVSISASGAYVVVAWVSSSTGTVKARLSDDGGRSWRSTITVGSGADAGTAAATFARSGRVVAAWVDGAVVRYATWTASSGWVFVTLRLGPAYLGVEDVAVSPLGFAIVACRQSCDPKSAAYGADLVWREHDGPYWHAPRVLAGTGDATTAIGTPSVIAVGSTVRFVMVPLRSAETGLDRLRLRQGIGRP